MRRFLRHALGGKKQSQSAPVEMDFRSLITPSLLANSPIFTDASPHVYHVRPDLVVKTSYGVRLTEAHTMRYVAENTSIPTPKVYDAFVRDDGQVAIAMEYVPGMQMEACWPFLSPSQKESIINELKDYMAQLRALPNPLRTGRVDFIGSIDGTACADQFFDDDPGKYGPFVCEADFTNALCTALRATASNHWTEMTCRFLDQLPAHETVFTHNDLAPRNILIREGRIAAIIDWDMSGFFPAHWEYVKAHLWANFESPWIAERILDQILEPYLIELACLLHVRDIVG